MTVVATREEGASCEKLSENTAYSPDIDGGPESTSVDGQVKYSYSALPTPSVEKLFSSKVSALQAFHFLGMHKGAPFFRCL